MQQLQEDVNRDIGIDWARLCDGVQSASRPSGGNTEQ